MDNIFGFPLAPKDGVSSEKNGTLLHIIIIVSSGILSSSAIATGLKAWFDNRKTTLTIQIDGEKKSLIYEGHHLDKDGLILQTIMEKLGEHTNAALPVGTVTIDLTGDGQKEQATLATCDHQEITTLDDCEKLLPRQQVSLLKRFLLVLR